ncbi:hypothetical protein GT354_38685, partial [Streptomyces sp. SID3343]|nr:hypothetical protein [Streptomyces sp. SID3343]
MGRSRGPERDKDRRPKSAADVALALPAPFAPLSDNAVLIADEQRDLMACEAAIETLKVAFWAAGKALNVIRDARLYRARFETFEDYCLTRWGMQR